MYSGDFNGVMLKWKIKRADVELEDGATKERVYIKDKHKIRR